MCRLEEDNAKLRSELDKWKQAGKAEQAERVRLEMESVLRPAVRRFAVAMENQLRANDHKGGWTDESREWLLGRVRDEVDELHEVVRNDLNSDEVMREAADVANFAMMIADVSEQESHLDKSVLQTHYREGDLVEIMGGSVRRLGKLVETEGDLEIWSSPESFTGSVALPVGKRAVLERDGVPTHEGLRRLARLAGFTFVHYDSSAGLEGIQIDDGIPHSRGKTATLYGDEPEWRKRLATILQNTEDDNG